MNKLKLPRKTKKVLINKFGRDTYQHLKNQDVYRLITNATAKGCCFSIINQVPDNNLTQETTVQTLTSPRYAFNGVPRITIV